LIEFPKKFYNSIVKQTDNTQEDGKRPPRVAWGHAIHATAYGLIILAIGTALFFANTPQRSEVVAAVTPAEHCDIKATTRRGANGNIKTFYFPHDPGYFSINADELFCTSQEARLNGYSPLNVNHPDPL